MSRPIVPGGAFVGAVVPDVPATKAFVDTAVAAYLAANPPVSSGGSVAWSAVTGKPSTFVPESHSHAQSEITGLTTALGNKQPIDATLTALAAVTTSANKLIYATASDTFTTADFTAAGRALVDDADATAQRATLGLGTAAVRNITINTSDPSGGADNDIWIKVPV